MQNLKLIGTTIGLLLAVVTTAQPMVYEAKWDGYADAFAYRDFVNKTYRIKGLPVVIDKEVEYFRSRQLIYEVKGETPNRGKIFGYDGAETLRFEGTYLRNALYGPAKTYHTDGSTRDSGLLLMNLPHGEWVFYNQEGTVKSIRNYDAFMWWNLQWSIEMNNPTWNWFQLTETYLRKPSTFTNAIDGPSTFDNRYSPPFANCIQHGKVTNFHDNGIVSDSGYYYKGLKDGIWFQFHTNGALKEFGAYKMGTRIGTWKTLYPSGKLETLRVYRYGNVAEGKTYTE